MAIDSNIATLKLYEHFKSVILDCVADIPDVKNNFELVFDTNLQSEYKDLVKYVLFCQRGIISEGKETLSIDVTDNGRERYYSDGYAVISIYAPKNLTKASINAELLGASIKRELRKRCLKEITILNVRLLRLSLERNCYRYDVYMMVQHSEIY